jgi:hypothetical protein
VTRDADSTRSGRRTSISSQVDAALVVARRLDSVLDASRTWGEDLRTWVEDVRGLVDVVLPNGQLRSAMRRSRALSTTSHERMRDLYTSSATDLGILPSDTPRMAALRFALGHAYDAGVDSADAALTRIRAEAAVATAELRDSQRECDALHRAMDRLSRGDDADG